jgi:hypothetical protein
MKVSFSRAVEPSRDVYIPRPGNPRLTIPRFWYSTLTFSPAAMELDQCLDTTGLREIGNLASWTVSTFKPGCGVEALRDEDTRLFWQ